jgi:hypothetical protein
MNDTKERNLDYLAAKHAQELVKAGAEENTLTKALGVLQENGVYACFLYLYAREGQKGETIATHLLNLFASLQFPAAPAASKENEVKKEEVLKYVAEHITANLPRLLLAKEALEQMLIYARYGAKAQA